MLKEPRHLLIHTHSREHNSKIVLGMIRYILTLHKLGIPTNLCTDLIMWKTVRGEKRDLLTSRNGVHDINRRNTSLNHLLGVLPLKGVNRLPLNILKVLSQDWWTAIHRLT